MNDRSFSAAPAARHARRRARDRAERRADILQAAARVFGDKGYHEASIAEIAAAADYGTGTLYLYFENKEDLYVALLEEKMHELVDRVQQAAARTGDPWEAIRNAVGAQLEFYEQNRTFFQSFVRDRLEMKARLPREKWERVTRAHERFLRHLSRLLEEGQRQQVVRPADSRSLALALSGMVSHLTRDALRRPRRQPLARRTAFVFDLFRRGAGRGDVLLTHETAN